LGYWIGLVLDRQPPCTHLKYQNITYSFKYVVVVRLGILTATNAKYSTIQLPVHHKHRVHSRS